MRNISTVTKRILDIIGSLTGLVILSPVFLVVYVLVLRKMGKPVIFKHPRAGKNGIDFTLYKFRTMTDTRDKEGKLLPDGDRLTPFGKMLRRTSLDELPQLLNVLKGNMSLVGPRPLLLEYVSLYSKEQVKRLTVKPGITGWAQINGRNSLSWEEKFKLDVWYVENWNLWLDLKIFFLTFEKVIAKKGISNKGEATMPLFTGNHSTLREISEDNKNA